MHIFPAAGIEIPILLIKADYIPHLKKKTIQPLVSVTSQVSAPAPLFAGKDRTDCPSREQTDAEDEAVLYLPKERLKTYIPLSAFPFRYFYRKN